jgi:hypothetical protein
MDPPSRPGRVARRYARPIPHPLPTRIPSTAASPLLPWRRERTGGDHQLVTGLQINGQLVRGVCEFRFQPPSDRQHAIQVRLLGSSPMVFDTRRTTVQEFAETATGRSWSRYSRVATSRRRSGHFVAGEASVSAYGERNAENTSSYSNRGICRIYCDGPGRRDVARVGAAAADV